MPTSAGEQLERSTPADGEEATLGRLLKQRRSIRDYAPVPLRMERLSQLLWAGQGVTGPGHRTTPSAGRLHPIVLRLVARHVVQLSPRVYRYLPEENQLTGAHRAPEPGELTDAALGQSCVEDAPAVIAISGIVERTRSKYGDRAERYVHLEAGHAAQNIYLAAQDQGLGTVAVGAFEDTSVATLLGLPADERPIYLMPVGQP